MATAANISLEAFMTHASVKMGRDFNDQQLELAKDFTKPVISFSYPGTGKTETALLGLITAELFHGVPGENIYALSFTRNATNELKYRHEAHCKKLGIKQKPVFKTLSALCRQILIENAGTLGFTNLKITNTFTIADLTEYLLETAATNEIPLDPYKVRPVIQAIRSLNSSLIFDRVHVESKMVFTQTGLSYEHFTILRKALYDLNKIVESIQLDDIFLYTLELFMRDPELSKRLKSKIKVFLLDEIQDVSLLQLRLASYMSDNVVAMGDIRQQIYGFNGACQEIVAQYKKYFPTAREVTLFQSYRCGSKIADYATTLILPNKLGGSEFKGKEGLEGSVELVKQASLSDIAKNLHEDFIENNHVFAEDNMFIFRNNMSAIPLADEFYKLKLPFRVNNYKPAHQIPVIQDICAIVDMCRNPTQAGIIKPLMYLIDEFSGYSSVMDVPVYKIMQKEGCSFLEAKYQYKNPVQASSILTVLKEVVELLKNNSMTFIIFNTIWPIYEPHLRKKEHFLEQPASYYTNLVAPLIQNKTYQQFTKDELDKVDHIQESVDRRVGPRCYTMHGAKGTEADVVYILDADEGIVPNTRKLEKTLEAGCIIDAAREIRNERCLVYVAATRAKKRLYVGYTSQISTLFTQYNAYANLDKAYESFTPNYNDVEVFSNFYQEDIVK